MLQNTQPQNVSKKNFFFSFFKTQRSFVDTMFKTIFYNPNPINGPRPKTKQTKKS